MHIFAKGKAANADSKPGQNKIDGHIRPNQPMLKNASKAYDHGFKTYPVYNAKHQKVI